MSAHEDPLEGMRAESKRNAVGNGKSPSGRLEADLWILLWEYSVP